MHSEQPHADAVLSQRSQHMETLRQQLVDMVAQSLTPIALRYGYSEVPLESNIKWRPQVLVLGNYSSGKSTLINELLGQGGSLQTQTNAHPPPSVQATGQAPTDDSFTVITYDEAAPEASAQVPLQVTEEREGKVLLNDPQYPYGLLKKHGQRFAAHFRLKKVNSPFLRGLALIDTPGMLDSLAERDRGYNYQEVVGDLAQVADLVLVLFDPHKAGTVRELHASLRETLPANTLEDRVIFVLNRIDECQTLTDLLRVYGTLCWNLSQMLGRKDIPMIRLTYSPGSVSGFASKPEYLRFLENQREELKQQILQAPKYRLDHLTDYVETHGERLQHLLEALISYRTRKIGQRLKLLVTTSALLTIIAVATCSSLGTQGDWTMAQLAGVGVALVLVGLGLFVGFLLPAMLRRWHKQQLQNLDDLTPLNTQSRRDSWQAVRDLVTAQLKNTVSALIPKQLRQDQQAVRRVCEKGAREVRSALNELSTVRHT